MDCVDSGASVGFLPPLDTTLADEYWLSIETALSSPFHHMLVYIEDEAILGTVQLAVCDKPNGRHRAEIQKLMVHTSARGRGISYQLMQSVESLAKKLGIKTLVLDTRLGDIASNLYRKMDYQEAGKIPSFVVNGHGELETTVYFYKLIA